jgi:tRNA threonylcarbamoyladenosine biosynthesis protein TsaE
MFNINFESYNQEQTIEIASNFIKNLENKNCLIFLNGHLGAGKTHFTKGIFKGLGFDNYTEINSPTFEIVNVYQIPTLKINHLDLYRIENLDSEDELWLNDVISENGLSIIEWGNKFEFRTTKKCYFVNIFIKDGNERRIEISSN